MDSIQPYDYSKQMPYNHAYLSGFYAERFNEEVNTEKTIEPKLINETKKQLLSDTHFRFTNTYIKSSNLNIVEHKIKYGLLPVYMLNVKYGKRIYTFAMNGQTGKFIGTLPINKPITISIITLIFVLIFILCSNSEKMTLIETIISSLFLTTLFSAVIIAPNIIKKTKQNSKTYINPKDLVIKKTTNTLRHTYKIKNDR